MIQAIQQRELRIARVFLLQDTRMLADGEIVAGAMCKESGHETGFAKGQRIASVDIEIGA